MGGWTRLLAFLATGAIMARSDQQVFQQDTTPGSEPLQRLFYKTNSTGNLIFWSVSSLLQQLPNTRYTNGHTITAATVPPGTILYHGRRGNDRRTKLDWLATDPDHSFHFCFGMCHLYTYVTSRPLRLAYFDGSSAAKLMYSGVMDAQDIVIWGKVRPDMSMNEPVRIRELCKWGEKFKLDGFVRMEMDFEIMVCDLDAGMELVSESEIIPHYHEEGHFHSFIDHCPRSDVFNPFHRAPPPHPPPYPPPYPPPHPPPFPPTLELPRGWRGRIRSDVSSSFGVIDSGMWHNRFPGETRVKIDYSRIVSFFDPALASLVEARTGKSRGDFRLDEISEADSKYIRDQLTDIFTRDGQGSGIDWGSITQVIVDRYGGRLELLQHVLQNRESKRNVTEQVTEARSQVLIMLTPYMLTSAIPPDPTGPVDPSWIDPVVKHCVSTHTAWVPEALLTPQEKVIKRAVEEVLSQICSVLGEIWVDAFDSERAEIGEPERFLRKWGSDIAELMDWLGWSIWLKCSPSCGPEEICYIPTWPWGYVPDEEPGRVDMTPRCVEGVMPYRFLLPPGPRRHS